MDAFVARQTQSYELTWGAECVCNMSYTTVLLSSWHRQVAWLVLLLENGLLGFVPFAANPHILLESSHRALDMICWCSCASS